MIRVYRLLAKLHGHDVVLAESRLFCRSCLISVSPNAVSSRAYAKSKCVPIHETGGHAIQNVPTPCHLHHSHKMSVLEGLHFC